MNKSQALGIAIAMLIGAGIGFGYYQYSHRELPQAAPAEKPVAEATVTPAETPDERYPVSPSRGKRLKKSLPALSESDLTLEEELTSLVGKPVFDKLFIRTEIIRRLVATVSNATEEDFPLELFPFHPLTGKIRTIKKGDKIYLDPKNGARYLDYVQLAEKTDLKELVDIYQTFYPLIDGAYRESNPEGHFNDHLIQAIDHLISTPDASGDLELTALNKSYQFADPKWEELSASQKILIRMGSENARVVKASLSKLRNILILGQ